MDWTNIREVSNLLNKHRDIVSNEPSSGFFGKIGMKKGIETGQFSRDNIVHICFDQLITGNWNIDQAREYIMKVIRHE